MRWCFAHFVDREKMLKADATAMQRRALLLVAAHWAVVSARLPYVLGYGWIEKGIILAGMLASGLLLLRLLWPRWTRHFNVANLHGPRACRAPIPGTLSVALKQQRFTVRLRNRENNLAGTRSQQCMAAAAAGILVTVGVMFLHGPEPESAPPAVIINTPAPQFIQLPGPAPSSAPQAQPGSHGAGQGGG
jgi:hypothetical protein